MNGFVLDVVGVVGCGFGGTMGAPDGAAGRGGAGVGTGVRTGVLTSTNWTGASVGGTSREARRESVGVGMAFSLSTGNVADFGRPSSG